MKMYFVKGVNKRFPNRWYVCAHPQTDCVQQFYMTDIVRVRLYVENLGFKPCKKRWGERKLYISFRNKSDEALFIMQIACGIEI